MFKNLLAIFLFFFYSLEAFQVNFAEDNPNSFRPGQIVRIDLEISNQEKHKTTAELFITADDPITPLISDQLIELEPSSEEVVSCYFRISPEATAGEYRVLFRLANDSNSEEIEKIFEVERISKIWLGKYHFDQKSVKLEVHNDSNFSIFYKKTLVEPYTTKEIPFTFSNKSSKNFYLEKIQFYSGDVLVSEFSISSTVYDHPSEFLKNTDFNYPINLGILYSGNKSNNSFTIYANGGGKFAQDQSLKFSFSAPFYNGTDPYLFYNPDTAIFLFDYQYKNLNLIVGDTNFNLGPILYYRYGRGYAAGYEKKDQFSAKLGYVTKNSFYKSKENDLFLAVESQKGLRVYYHSFSDFHRYNQDLGVEFKNEKENQKLHGLFEIYNTNFDCTKDRSGFLAKADYISPNLTFNSSIDYLGNQFYGRTNSEFKLIGTLQGKIPSTSLGGRISGSYQESFPVGVPLTKIVNINGSFSTNIGKAYNALNLDYITYDNQEINRKNFSAYYNFNNQFSKNVHVNLNQGITYVNLEDPFKKVSWKSYTQFTTNYHYGRWDYSFGVISQVRYFSSYTNPENSAFAGVRYSYDNTSAFVNFNFSNATYQYKPYINLNLKTRLSPIDIELDYQLIPKFGGYDWRALAKFNFLRYITFKKKTRTVTQVYDTNTQKLIDGLKGQIGSNRFVTIQGGSVAERLSGEELDSLAFSGLESERKVKMSVQEDHILKEYTYHVDYFGKVRGKVNIHTDTPRPSITKLLLEQKVLAIDTNGKSYYGRVFSDGSFVVRGLPVGHYTLLINTDDLPSEVSIDRKEVTIDYQSNIQEIDFTARY